MFNIPSRLMELLQRDQSVCGCILSTAALFEPILSNSSLPFFPEYTDHSIEHLQGVLNTADALIAEPSRPYLTPSDAGALILGVILHDLGLHLTEDGFASLISPN